MILRVGWVTGCSRWSMWGPRGSPCGAQWGPWEASLWYGMLHLRPQAPQAVARPYCSCYASICLMFLLVFVVFLRMLYLPSLSAWIWRFFVQHSIRSKVVVSGKGSRKAPKIPSVWAPWGSLGAPCASPGEPWVPLGPLGAPFGRPVTEK